MKRYMVVAEAIATLSKDPSTKVGCVILDSDRRVRAVGYNGFSRGVADTGIRLHNRDTKLKFIAHAETNAIANAAAVGTPLKGTTLVVTKHPCDECAKVIINAGITQVICPNPTEKWIEHSRIATIMFKEAGVEVVLYGEEND